ncbi:MAG: hypothetical protein FWD18_11190 [Micrococcales bacterium]|nr:hypothetical protein [Micrococcales bacterium]
MSITYEQAAEIVYSEGVSGWEPSWGTFILDDRSIMEDDEVFVFIVGAREMLVDMNPDFMTVGGGNGVVSKADGTLRWIPWVFIEEERPDLTQRPNPRPTYFH